MPRYDRSRTPSERQRAPKGSIVAAPRLQLTREEVAALEHLMGAWNISRPRAAGRALLEAAKREGWSPTE